jgi:hypothetical protein
MNQSWPPRCRLRDSTREDGVRVLVAWIEMEGTGAVMDGDDEKGSGVASGVRWRVALRDGDCCCGSVGLGLCRLRDLYHDAISPCGESDGVGADSA